MRGGVIGTVLVPTARARDKMAVFRTIIHAAATVRDLALPPRCPGCGAITMGAHQFCVSCWSGLDFIGPPWCAACHHPFDHDRGVEARCAACLEQPPRHAGVRAAVRYGEVARSLALRLKYGRRTGDAVTAARLMQRHLSPDADLLIPVPLHGRRLWQRGYNQAALIAAALSRESGVPMAVDLLRRTRATPVLRGLSRIERRRALRNAFAVSDGRDLRAAKIVLVDDVYTSGATAEGCADALVAAGAASVTVLAWARVLRAGPMPADCWDD